MTALNSPQEPREVHLPTVLVTPYLSDHHRIGSQGLLRGIEEWERNEAASLQVTASLQEAAQGHTDRRSIGH